MSDYQYTDALRNIDSSAVTQAYYNVHDKTLVVVMRSNGNAYRYDGVPSWVWQSFKTAGSKGNNFATRIKSAYGPSKYLGVGKNLNITEYSVAAPSMARVTPLHGGYVPLGGRASEPSSTRGTTVGTPKGLTYASDATVTTKAEAFPLSSEPKHVAASNSTTVVFEVGGSEKTTKFDNIGNVEDAVREINRLADMLGLDNLVVKSVTVHFG